MANTNILIKRSLTTPTPSSLKQGELAYSYNSNTIFLGSPTGDGAIKIGGQYYTNQIDNSTASNVPGTIVRRDAVGNSYFGNVIVSGYITGTIQGVAGQAAALEYPQNFSIGGGDITASAVSFNGTAPVALSASLNTVAGLSAGTYGGSTAIPVVQVAANGRIMAISNTSLSTSFTVSGNTGSGTQNTGGTLTVQGASGTGITTTVSGSGGNETVTINTDGSYIRSSYTTPQSVGGDFQIAGNLVVSGTTTSINTSTVTTNDSLIKLASNNTVGDIVDIGFYGASNTGSSVAYHGLIREGSGGTNAGNFYLFKNLATDPTGNTVNYAGLSKATLYADLSGATGLPVATGISGFGTGIASALSVNTGSTGSVVLYNGALGTPSSGTLTNATGLPVSTGISGLGTGVATALAAGVTGSGTIALSQSPTFTGVANFTTINAASINVGTTTYVATNVLGSFTGSTNGYEQFIIQNSNNGSQASVDFIVSNDKSTDFGYYGDYGMNSSGFTGSGSFSLPNAVYLAAANTDLSIGTYNANAIHFVVNSSSSDAMTISSGGVVSLGTALAYGSGGTGSTSYTTSQLLVSGATGFTNIANTGTAGSYGSSSYIPVLTTDAYGRVSAVSNTQISIDIQSNTTGTLGVARGGTGATSFATGQVVIGAGTNAMQSLANVSAISATVSAANTIASFVTDVYGRVTTFTQQAISGLTVGQGGTGASSFTTNGIIYGNSGSAMQVTAAAGTSDQTFSNQILTVTNAGVPVWTNALDGGTF